MFSGGIVWPIWQIISNFQLKSSKLVVTINNLLADLFICQTVFAKIFIHPLSPNIIIAKLFRLYSTSYSVYAGT